MFEMRLSWEAVEPLPGQFFTIRVGQSASPLLRRPFAFSAYDAARAEVGMIYQRRGLATELLTCKGPGDRLDVIGPLGNGFDMAQDYSRAILVAGGIGLGPMLFLWSRLMERGQPILFIVGFHTSAQLPCSELLGGFSAVICTDDGSAGFAGTVIDYLQTLDPEKTERATVFACGPYGMLRSCATWSQQRRLPCQVSLEQTMACGVGACMGCAVRVAEAREYARVCTEGPVFDAATIIWAEDGIERG